MKKAEHRDDLDLTLTRIIDAPAALVWRAWTEPEHFKRWWTPAPVETIVCEMDVRPGGVFRTVMRMPDGTEMPSEGAFLHVVSEREIVFTDALLEGFRPSDSAFFTAIITLEEIDGGTRYTARAMHKNAADRDKHEKMGFHQGWGTAIDQLAALVGELAND